MFKIIAGAMSAAWVIAGWRNLPPIPNHYSGGFGFVLATVVMLAYYAGTRRKRDAAVAIAVAKAEAKALASVQATTTSSAQVVLNLDPSVGARRAGIATGLDSAEWLAGAAPREQIESHDAIESMIEDVDRQEA